MVLKMKKTGNEFRLKNSRGIGRSGAIWVRTVRMQAADTAGAGEKDDVLVSCFSQKVGTNPPIQLLMDVNDAQSFVKNLQAQIRTIKGDGNGR